MTLTKAEERVMLILWRMEKGFIRDILDQMKEPKPAYTTVATVVNILQKKGFVAFRSYGNAHQFYPVIAKTDYSKKVLNTILKKYFKGSVHEMVTFFGNNNKIKQKDINEAIKVLKQLKVSK
jgi:predicted transcriptional regulator